ncbi:ATP-binding cassette domain-containing protein [Thermopolyspora sp. NPDC052614]|uniref:ABC transporter ATP-binding protein n=1 Tax=Thermopolyspora sp. NPDC052614 TaxID=3155682 RepID=UPI0034214474
MRLSNVSFRYSRRGPWIFRGVDLDLPGGAVLEVTGRNGAGKSTLLKLLAGVMPPTGGRIVDRPDGVGYAPEVFPAAQPFSAAAYLAHLARVRGAAPAEIGTWAERLGMSHLLAVPLAELSKGSGQKVGILQALLGTPGLVILDEPFSGLDARTREDLRTIIGEVAGRGGIVVVSDHQNALRGLAHTTRLLVEDGTIRAVAVEERPAPRPRKVVEVVVDADEADDVRRALQAEGRRARIRDFTTADEDRWDLVGAGDDQGGELESQAMRGRA